MSVAYHALKEISFWTWYFDHISSESLTYTDGVKRVFVKPNQPYFKNNIYDFASAFIRIHDRALIIYIVQIKT